ncbi:MAG: hypothetical protein ACP5JX_01570 [Sulfurihydrogenibium sp.]
MKKFLIISLILFSKSFAVDNLYLNGKVEDYFPLTNELKVKVGDGSCSGTQYFILDKNLNGKALVGKKINFVIDSSSCEKNKKYKILKFMVVEE